MWLVVDQWNNERALSNKKHAIDLHCVSIRGHMEEAFFSRERKYM